MKVHTIGEISLSITATIYVVWLLPQVWHNYKRKTTQGLSFTMHTMLFLGFCTDLLYGFGLHMQWQYRMSTIAFLLQLFVQHYQFRKQFLATARLYKRYLGVTILISALLVIEILIILLNIQMHQLYLLAGATTMITSLLFWLPQIYCNYQLKQATGLSMVFLLLTFFLRSLDLTSALCLSWKWPSIYGPIFGIFLKVILLIQFYVYADNRIKNKE